MKATKAQEEEWIYVFVGLIERGPRYQWKNGYARVVNGATEQPWMTRAEARADASANRAKAIFVQERGGR